MFAHYKRAFLHRIALTMIHITIFSMLTIYRTFPCVVHFFFQCLYHNYLLLLLLIFSFFYSTFIHITTINTLASKLLVQYLSLFHTSCVKCLFFFKLFIINRVSNLIELQFRVSGRVYFYNI